MNLSKNVKIFAGLFVVIVVSLIFYATLKPDYKIKAVHSNTVILAFGDSLTVGVGASKDESYPAVLQNLIGTKIINGGVSGETSAQGLSRLPALLKKESPALIIICHGGNDFLQKTDISKTEENIRKMIQLSKDTGSDVVLLGVPQPGLLLKAESFYSRIASDFKIPIENKVLPKVLGNAGLKSDYIHPNAKGYRIIAEAIAELIKTHEEE